MPKCVDIEDFVVKCLKMKIVYESIAEDDRDKIGFTSNGIYPLKVLREGRVVSVVFPKNTIVLDRYLLHVDESCRRRFTIAHEGSHAITERLDSTRHEACFHRVFDCERQYSAQDFHDRMNLYEWQADRMAIALLLPKFVVTQALQDFNAGRRLPVYGEGVFHPREKVILKKMADSLGVSHTVLVSRLRGFNMLNKHDLSEYIVLNVLPGGCGN